MADICSTRCAGSGDEAELTEGDACDLLNGLPGDCNTSGVADSPSVMRHECEPGIETTWCSFKNGLPLQPFRHSHTRVNGVTEVRTRINAKCHVPLLQCPSGVRMHGKQTSYGTLQSCSKFCSHSQYDGASSVDEKGFHKSADGVHTLGQFASKKVPKMGALGGGDPYEEEPFCKSAEQKQISYSDQVVYKHKGSRKQIVFDNIVSVRPFISSDSLSVSPFADFAVPTKGAQVSQKRYRLIGKQPPSLTEINRGYLRQTSGNSQCCAPCRQPCVRTLVSLAECIPPPTFQVPQVHTCNQSHNSIDDRIYGFPLGCIMRTHGNVSPFPLACPNWVELCDWQATTCSDLEAYGRAGVAANVSEAVSYGQVCVEKLSVPHMSCLSDFEGASLKYSTSAAILASYGGSIKYNTIVDAVHLDIFTDGSGKEDTPNATWAFCVIGTDPLGNQTVHGGLFGKVTTDSTSISYIGADCDDNSVAEISAQTFANLWLLQAGSDIANVRSVCINFDSKFAAGIINGEIASRKYCNIVRLSQGIFLQCQARWQWSYQWVKGHSDHPWNELADTLCSWCREVQVLPVCSIPFDVEKDVGKALQLAYDYGSSMHNHDGISALPDTLVDRVSWQLSSKVISQWIDKHNDNIQHANVQTCVLHGCQYNAQSLIKCGADKLLAAQACKRKVHIIGVQESRYKKCRICSCGPFLRVTSGSPHGTHGCEIWFSLTLSFAKINQCDCYVDANSVTILHHEPRRLLVKCCCANKSFVCVSLHAPYLGNDELDVSKWWCETLTIIKKFCNNSPTFVFADANLAIPRECNTVCDNRFGNIHRPNKLQVGRDASFSQFLIESGVSAFGSIESKLVGVSNESNVTYVGKISNKGKTIDHILGKDIVCVERSYCTWFDFVASHDGLDHFPVLCKIQWNSSLDTSFSKRRVVPYDRRKIGRPECDCIFNQCIAMCPVIPFCIEPTTHAWLTNMCILNAAMAAYPFDPGNRKHQKYISDATFMQIQANARILRQATKVNIQMKYASCKVAINAWKFAVRHCDCPARSCSFVPQQKWSDFYSWIPKYVFRASLATSRRWKAAHVKIKSWLRLEYLAYIDMVTEGIDNNVTSILSTDMHTGVKQAMNATVSKPVKVLRICNSDGFLVSTAYEERIVVRDHFAKQLDGTVISFEELIDRDRITPNNLHANMSSDSAMCLVVSSMQIAAGNRTHKRNAPGENLLVPELSKRSSAYARVMFPLRLKTIVRLAPPLQWRGGMLCELFKNKGCSSDCGNYRDITLADVDGKDFSKQIRSCIVHAVRGVASETQFGGGMNDGDTSKAHLYLRTIGDIAKSIGLSAGFLFVDIVSAFATLCRSIVFPDDRGDEAFLQSLAAAGFNSHEIDDIYDCLSISVSSSMRDGQNDTAIALCSRMYHNTWVSIEGLAQVLSTSTGSGAGTPLADVMYISAISKVVLRLRGRLIDHDLVFSVEIPTLGETLLKEVGYVDDSAFSVVGPASNITAMLKKVAELANYTFNEFRMVLTWKPGKSEALCVWNGTGAKSAARKVFADNSVIVCEGIVGNFDLRIVSKYKHLGTTFPSMKDEIAIRSAIIRSTARSMGRKVLRNEGLSVPKRLAICQTYIWSRGLFQCGTWPELGVAEYKKIHSAVLYAYRTILPDEKAKSLNDDEVISELSAMCPMTFLRARRLCMLARLCGHSLWLVHLASVGQKANKSWFSTCMSDLKWISNFPGFLSCKAFGMSEWVDRIVSNPGKFRKSVVRICAMPLANVVTQWANSPALLSLIGTSKCFECGKAYLSKQALSVHRFKVHNVRSIERRYAAGTQCTVSSSFGREKDWLIISAIAAVAAGRTCSCDHPCSRLKKLIASTL